MILNGHADPPDTNSTAKPRSTNACGSQMLSTAKEKVGQLAMHIFYPHA